MTKTVAIHSFRRGTGKSILCANLATLLAMSGYQTALIDLDMISPSAQLLFGLSERDIVHTVNDYVLGQCLVEQTVLDVTPHVHIRGEGHLFVAPSSSRPNQLVRIVRREYDIDLLGDAFHRLVEGLNLDVLLIDTPAGINDDTLATVASAQSLAAILRLDRRDYQGTSVILDLARRLAIPELHIIVNQVAPGYDPGSVHAEVSRSFGCEVAAVLPHSPQLTAFASSGIFVHRYPHDPFTGLLRQLATRLTGFEIRPPAGD